MNERLEERRDGVYLYADGARGLKWYRLGKASDTVADWQGKYSDDSPTLGECAKTGKWVLNEVWGGISCN